MVRKKVEVMYFGSFRFPNSSVEWDNEQPLMELLATPTTSDLVKYSCLATGKRKSIRIKTNHGPNI